MKFKDLKYKDINSSFNRKSLEHLKPEVIALNRKKILLLFSIHTWTENRTSDNPDTNINYIEEHFLQDYIDGKIIKSKKEVVDKRTFDEERYNASIKLKEIIKGLNPNQKLTKDNRDWFIIKYKNEDKFYHIFMNIKKSNQKGLDYVMTITSAHYRKFKEGGKAIALKHVIK